MGILFFVSILGYALLAKHFLPQIKTGAALYLSFVSMLSLSYVLIILLNMYVVIPYVLIYGGIAAGFCVCLKHMISEKKISLCGLEIKRLVIWGSMVALFISLLGAGVFKAHDAYSFWGRAVKELYLFKELYINSASNIAHSDYNPIVAALSYCVTTVFGWQEKYLYFVIIAAVSTILMMLCDTIKSNKYSLICMILSMICITMLGWTFSTAFIGADLCLGLYFTAGIVAWTFKKDNSIASVLPVLLTTFILPAIKLYTGLLFAVIIFVYMIYSGYKSHEKKVIKYGIVALALLLFMQLSWSVIYNYHMQRRNFDIENEIAEYMGEESKHDKFHVSVSGLLKGNPRNTMLKESLNNPGEENVGELIEGTCNVWMATSVLGADLTIIEIFSLFLFAMYLMCLLQLGTKELPQLLRVYIIAAAFYIVGMFVTYLVQPGTANEPIRYLGIVIIPFIITYFQEVCKSEDRKMRGIYLSATLLILIFVIGDRREGYLKAYSAEKDQEYFMATYVQQRLEEDLNDVLEKIPKEDNLLIIDAYNDELVNGKGISGFVYSYQYWLLPRRVSVCREDFDNVTGISAITKEYYDDMVRDNRIDKIVILSNQSSVMKSYSSLFNGDNADARVMVVDVKRERGKIVYDVLPDFQEKWEEVKCIPEMTLDASDGMNYQYQLLLDTIDVNRKYLLKFENVDVVDGNTDAVDVVMYDFENAEVVVTEEMDANIPEQNCYFGKHRERDSNQVALLVYAGKRGATSGNVIQLKNVKIFRNEP